MEILGRALVIDEVIRRLGDSRLLTITGPGGIGKTTVADEIARREAHRYPLGVHRIDLTTVEDDREVAAALAAQLGFGSFRALLDSPTDQPALVVVDNCEHVLDAASEAVVALLDACRSPTVVATSRSPLGVAGESVVVLAPLDLPGEDGDERGSPAVQLFLRRARDAGANIPDSEIAAVARVCRLVDGVPLAIELAASRSRVLTPSELLDRLGDLDTLRRSQSRGPVRHRSLRDTIAWSYALLHDDDQRFFDRLSVLAGPFTAEDAQAVAGEHGPASTIDRLDRLVANSLLSTSVVAGSTYHRQLELVRSYARERLVASDEWDQAWQRFVDRVTQRSIQLIADSSPGWDRSSVAALLGRVDHHLAVLRWCIDQDDSPSRSFVLVSTLWGVVHQGRLGDIAPLAERVLERWDDPTLPGWADAAATTATCRYLAGRPQEAIDLARRALEHAGDARYAPCTLRRVIAHAHVSLGDLEGAIDILSEAIDIAADRVPALAMEMTVSRAELQATAAGPSLLASGGAAPLLDAVRSVARDAAQSGSLVNEIWARSVHASILSRTDPRRASEQASGALLSARAGVYPSAETVNLHTLASLLVDDGDLPGAAVLTRQLVDGLVSRGAEAELRNGLRLAAVALERADRPAWRLLAATSSELPIVSLFSIPGHERHALPPADTEAIDVREAVVLARAELDTLSERPGERPLDGAGSNVPPVPTRVATEAPSIEAPSINVWCRAGDVWKITFDGLEVQVRTSKGMVDLARLLAAPDTEVHCIELAGAVVEDRASGEVIDAHARRDYERRVRELQGEIDEAEADADFHRADRARDELDAIVDHLTAALGLGGRVRRHTDGVERARSTVTQRIRSSIKRLRTVHPALAAHLEVSVQTGIYCRYRPERPTVWSTVGPAS
jgi:predicted ATPase